MQEAAFPTVETEDQAKRGPGRPSTVTLEIVEKVARLIAKGMTEEQACLSPGVNHASLRTARHRNPEFETAFKEAQAEFRIPRPHWQRLAWLAGPRVDFRTSPR